jgi:hypothetical protein
MSLIKYRNGNALKVESAFGATSTTIAMEDRYTPAPRKTQPITVTPVGRGIIARHHSNGQSSGMSLLRPYGIQV